MDGRTMAGRMMGTKEVAAYLHLNEKKVYALARAGKIPAVRLTGKWLFPRETLDAWLAVRARAALSGAPGAPEAPGAAGGEMGAARPPGAALVVAGSDDPLLRGLLDELSLRPESGLLAFAGIGSAGGIRAAAAGQADLACCHLAEGGEFNLPFLPRLAPGLRGKVVAVARRRQGIVAAPGNPLGLRAAADLGRPGLRIVNRRPGAGTRLLLDAELARAGLDPERIAGYGDEVDTHIEVAARVLRGEADAGVACETAARMVGAAFVPLCEERFDLIVPRAAEDRPEADALVAALRSPAFRRRAAALGGYRTEESGAVRAEF